MSDFLKTCVNEIKIRLFVIEDLECQAEVFLYDEHD